MGKIKITKGCGVIVDRNGNIIAKFRLPPGEHEIKDGYEVIEMDEVEFEKIKNSDEIVSVKEYNHSLFEKINMLERKVLELERIVKSLNVSGVG